MSIGLRRKHTKSNSIDRFQNTEVSPIDLEFGVMRAKYFRYMEIESQGIPSEWELDYGSWMDVRSDQRSSRQ